IVQPGAKDAVGEMGVGGGLPPGQRTTDDHTGAETSSIGRNTRGDACGVEVTEVHVETFYFPSPVTRTPEIYHPLRAVAQHPTGINMRLTEGLGSGACDAANCRPGDCARSVNFDLTIGQPPGQVAHHVPIPPHIADAATHRAEPIYFCRVVRNR